MELHKVSSLHHFLGVQLEAVRRSNYVRDKAHSVILLGGVQCTVYYCVWGEMQAPCICIWVGLQRPPRHGTVPKRPYFPGKMLEMLEMQEDAGRCPALQGDDSTECCRRR